MIVHGYTLSGSIQASIDGVEFTIPDDMANRHRQMIADWEAAGNAIPPYVPPLPPVPSEISRRQFYQEMANREIITKEEALAAIETGTLPPAFDALVSAIIDEDIKWQARMLLGLGGATTFLRNNWFVDYFAAMQGLSPAYMDDFWRAAALLT